MRVTSKYADDITILNASNMNVPLYEIDSNFDELEGKINTHIYNKNNFILQNQLVHAGIPNGRCVYFNGTEWNYPSIDPYYETPTTFPLGVTSAVTTSNRATIICLGFTTYMEAAESPTLIGVPYFLTTNGRITSVPQDRGIYIGQFIHTSSFFVHPSSWMNSHVHRRMALLQGTWEDHTTYILYPLPQLPKPVNGGVLVINSQFTPPYGKYTIDEEGLKITDLAFFQTLLSTANVYTYLSNNDCEFFWSDPKTDSTTVVRSLTAATDNIIIQDRVTQEEKSYGDLNIKVIPEIETVSNTTSLSTVVKDVGVNPSSGEIELTKGTFVQKITAGNNISLTSETGDVRISAYSTNKNYTSPDDILLRGSLSRIYAGTINQYIELTNVRQNGFILMKRFPINLDITKKIEIYADIWGIKLGDCSIQTKSCNLEYITAAPILDTTTVNISVPYKVETHLIASYYPNQITKLYIGREIDNTYNDNIGITSILIAYWTI